MYRLTKDMDQDPSQDNRVKLGDGRENTRKLLAEFLRVTPEEIVITRNTSESNNLVSTGIDLKAGDEVLLTADNHPSNHTAWQEKAKRFGFTVKDVPTPNPHPGMEYYVDAFAKAITPRTKVISFTHQTSTVGDLFPAKEICRLARERGILSLVDGAQSFGLMDVDLSDIQPDFYSGSSHKWICGPKENGVLYINKSAQSKIWASIFSAYPGRVGVSRTFEGFGQRDEPTMMAFGEALTFQTKIGRAQIEKRSRELTQALIAGAEDDRRREDLDQPGSVTRRSRWSRSCPAASTSASCRRRSTRRTTSAARRAAARIAPASGCRRTSTTPTPTSIAPSPRSRGTWRPASREGTAENAELAEKILSAVACDLRGSFSSRSGTRSRRGSCGRRPDRRRTRAETR